jgi:uncharacterized protein with FMN-binding domain
LTASVVATGAVAGALAYSEGAFSADGEDAAVDSNDEQFVSPTPTSTATPDSSESDSATSLTPGSSAAPATTAETTQPSELAVERSGYADGVYLGSAEYTEWGDVQVQVTISDGAIIDVAAVQYPTSRKSSSINNRAVPMLEAEAVTLQSADLDVVSGATYTSRTYADSLQAALDQAALAIAQERSTS